jgi:ABC-2 type transport system ATP-binding protein
MNTQMSEPAIALRDLSKNFGNVEAVRQVSLTIGQGTIFGFLGANGAGKTTTIRMLCGLTKPTGGSAEIEGADVWRHRHVVRTKFGYVAQRFSLYPDLTVLENMRFFGGACRVPRLMLEAQIVRLLKLTDLERKGDVPAGSLSGGMRQLLALGCALVHDPPLLFLDEPTSGLDPVHRQQIWNLLYDLSHRGKTVFVTTHYMDEAERCMEVGFLDRGQLLAHASPRELKESFKWRLLELDLDPLMPALLRLREAPEVLGVSLRSGRVRLYAPNPEELLARWQKTWPFPELKLLGHRWIEPDMEDVFTAFSQRYDAILRKGQS